MRATAGYRVRSLPIEILLWAIVVELAIVVVLLAMLVDKA